MHGVLQARVLEWVAISSPGGLPPPKDGSPGLLRWQADSLPLSHQGSPTCVLLQLKILKLKQRNFLNTQSSGGAA